MFVLVKELEKWKADLAKSREDISSPRSLRLPEAILEMAKIEAGEGKVQDQLREWLWLGVVTSAVMAGNGLRGRFWINEIEKSKRYPKGRVHVGIERFGRGHHYRQGPPGGGLTSFFEVWFDPTRLKEGELESRLSDVAVEAQNENAKAWKRKIADRGKLVSSWVARVMVREEPWPCIVEAGARSEKRLDDLLMRVASDAGVMIHGAVGKGKSYVARSLMEEVRKALVHGGLEKEVRQDIEREEMEKAYEAYYAQPGAAEADREIVEEMLHVASWPEGWLEEGGRGKGRRRKS